MGINDATQIHAAQAMASPAETRWILAVLLSLMPKKRSPRRSRGRSLDTVEAVHMRAAMHLAQPGGNYARSPAPEEVGCSTNCLVRPHTAAEAHEARVEIGVVVQLETTTGHVHVAAVESRSAMDSLEWMAEHLSGVAG